MQIYLVGGAVRDQLLGRPVTERDWVVIGATPEEMLARGFKPVGKDFPVFLHPDTHEEYALARTERKIARGYSGFSFYAAPNVSLEEDLTRRDLTINAMAQTETGELIDPYHGREDLENKILRHVSPAFAEDPVRILRVARFAARFPDFKVHPETNRLMELMVSNGEVDALVAERVWQEFHKALQELHPQRFFDILNDCGALAKLFPELASSLAEINKRCEIAVSYTATVERFAIIFTCLNLEQLSFVCDRFRIPREFRELTQLVIRYNQKYQTALNLSSEEILQLLEATDAMRKPDRFNQFLEVCAAVSQLHEQTNPEISRFLIRCLTTVNEVTIEAIAQQLGMDYKQLPGEKIKQLLRELKIKKIDELKIKSIYSSHG